MDKDKTPDPNLSEEISRNKAVTSQNQRGVVLNTGKEKMKSENFSPEGAKNSDFNREIWEENQAIEQKYVDDNIARENARQERLLTPRKGISTKVIKGIKWLMIFETLYEVGKGALKYYKEWEEENKKIDDKENVNEKPENPEEEKNEPVSMNNEATQIEYFASDYDSMTPNIEQTTDEYSEQPQNFYIAFDEQAENYYGLQEPGNVESETKVEDIGEIRTSYAFPFFEKDEAASEEPAEEISPDSQNYYFAFDEREQGANDRDETEYMEMDSGQYSFPFFEGDGMEIENDEDPVNDENERSFYLTLDEYDNDDREEYFEIDRSATQDFTEYRDMSDDMEMDMDGPDIGGADGGADGGGE